MSACFTGYTGLFGAPNPLGIHQEGSTLFVGLTRTYQESEASSARRVRGFEALAPRSAWTANEDRSETVIQRSHPPLCRAGPCGASRPSVPLSFGRAPNKGARRSSFREARAPLGLEGPVDRRSTAKSLIKREGEVDWARPEGEARAL